MLSETETIQSDIGGEAASFLMQCRTLFQTTIDLAQKALGDKAFRPERAFNAAVFDSVMVGVGEVMQHKKVLDSTTIAEAYAKLLADKNYLAVVSRSTADKAFVSSRLEKAIDRFAGI